MGYFTIIDNGPGIPKELRERVFERFSHIIDKPSYRQQYVWAYRIRHYSLNR